MTNESDDTRIDALVRAASARDVDEAALACAVHAKLAPRQAWLTLPRFGPNLAAAGFAAMLLVAGVAGYALPDLGGADDDLLLLAMTEPAVLDLSLITLGSEGDL